MLKYDEIYIMQTFLVGIHEISAHEFYEQHQIFWSFAYSRYELITYRACFHVTSAATESKDINGIVIIWYKIGS